MRPDLRALRERIRQVEAGGHRDTPGTCRRRITNEKAGEAEAQVEADKAEAQVEAGEAQVEAHKAFSDDAPVVAPVFNTFKTRRERRAAAEEAGLIMHK